MSRVINTDGPGKRRNQWRRTVAEALRRLIAKKELDAEARDLAAVIVLGLRGIADTIEETVEPWEKRDYYLKADRFRIEWEWASPAAERMARTIKEGKWLELPPQFAELLPRFSDIHIAKFTRSPDSWRGAYDVLMRE
jgi:hypothetical protein